MKLAVCVFFALCVAACETLPTPTPNATPLPSLAPSATVLPIIPDEDASAFLGRSDPTAAALAAEGEPSQEAPPPLLPTESVIPLMVMLPNGETRQADFYGAPQRPAPAVLLVGNGLESLGIPLQAAGFHAVFLHGTTAEEVGAALHMLRTLPMVSGLGLVAVGNDAAEAATLACEAGCQAIVLPTPISAADIPAIIERLRADLGL